MKRPINHLRSVQARRRALVSVVALIATSLTTVVGLPAPASAATVTQISAGGQTNCVVESDHNAYCWGDNQYGQFGNGTTTDSNTPQLVLGGYQWASISTQSHVAGTTGATCGITLSGQGYCWGNNRWGNVGDGTTTFRSTPTPIAGGYTWTQIVVSFASVCGITNAHDAYCWGYNGNGQLGIGNYNQQDSPAIVSGGFSWSNISIQNETSCGVTTSNVGYCWGKDTEGELGNGATGGNYNTPQVVSGSYSWSSITSGGYTSCGVTTSNVGYCWGGDHDYEIGDASTVDSNTPVAVAGGHSWSVINAGWATTCGITTSNVSYCWGYNNDGPVGNGVTSDAQTPTAVSGGLTFSAVVVGSYFTGGADDTTCGLTSAGAVYCWGYNNLGQVGDGTTTSRLVPTLAQYVPAGGAETTASATIDPTFTFTVANQSSTCNGESNFVSGAGTASAVALGHLAAGANVSGGQALSVAGNAGGGFAVYIRGTQASQNLRNGGHNWADVAGSYASPAALGSGERFGYTYNDSTASSSVTNPSAANFIALTNASTNAVMGSTSSLTGSGCVSYDAQTSGTTPAGSYTATIVYTAVPAF